MMFLKSLKVASAVSLTSVTGMFAIHDHVQNNFGPSTQQKVFQVGEKILHDGVEHLVIGYTGHHIETFQKDLTQRELYVGRKHEAQLYAHLNGREQGATGLVIAIGRPSFGIQRFEGPHAPLTPESMQSTQTKIIHVELLTDDVDLRTGTAYRRASKHYLSL